MKNVYSKQRWNRKLLHFKDYFHILNRDETETLFETICELYTATREMRALNKRKKDTNRDSQNMESVPLKVFKRS